MVEAPWFPAAREAAVSHIVTGAGRDATEKRGERSLKRRAGGVSPLIPPPGGDGTFDQGADAPRSPSFRYNFSRRRRPPLVPLPRETPSWRRALAPPAPGPTPGRWSCASSASTTSAPSLTCRPSPSRRSAPEGPRAAGRARRRRRHLLAAVPVYLYVVGRSPHGQGAIGMLERLVHGWFGKTLILVLLGFVATDYVVTRSLSVPTPPSTSIHDPFWQRAPSRTSRCARPPDGRPRLDLRPRHRAADGDASVCPFSDSCSTPCCCAASAAASCGWPRSSSACTCCSTPW